jgi:polyphosphate glucokinase
MKYNIPAMIRLGIDIGGSGIKGAPVDVETGALTLERHRFDTPQPATLESVADVVGRMIEHFDWKDPVGVTFPGVVKKGNILSAAHLDKSWIGTNGEILFSERSGCPVVVLNDADAAGLAEMTFGAGKDRGGVVILLTLGTGIGSAIFIDGVLLPNTEFGHMEIRGKDAEERASARIRKEKSLGWKKWSVHINEFLSRMDALFSPDLYIIGGGVSRRHDKFFKYLKSGTEIVPARMRNHAGIIGAALAARAL